MTTVSGREFLEFTPDWLRDNPQGAVTRLSTTLKGVSDAIAGAPEPA